ALGHEASTAADSWGSIVPSTQYGTNSGAFAVSGSPYHMFVDDGTNQTGLHDDSTNQTVNSAGITGVGHQDRSLKSSVVVVPDIKIEKLVSADGTNWYLQNDHDDGDYSTLGSAYSSDIYYLQHVITEFSGFVFHDELLP